MSNFVKDFTNFDIDDLTRRFKRHTYFIKSLKFIFPLMAVALIAALLIFPNIGNRSKKIIIEPVVVSETADKPAMINPRINGFDKDNQPYNISSGRAYQIAEKTILLQQISADITMANGSWASIITPEGIYKIEEKHLQITKDFEIFITEEDGGTINISGNGLDADLDSEIISSSGKLTAESPMGKLTANGFTIHKKEGIIRFKGRVKLIIKK